MADKKIMVLPGKSMPDFQPVQTSIGFFTTAKSIPELMNMFHEVTEFYFEKEEIKIRLKEIKFEIDGINPTLLSQ